MKTKTMNNNEKINIFLDTSQEEFAAAIFDYKFSLIKSTIIKTKFKVEEIPNFFITHEINTNNLENVFVNIGPGSFTGSRISLVFLRTIVQLNTKINFFITNSFLLASIDLQSNYINIPFTNSKIFQKNKQNLHNLDFEIKLKDEKTKITKINYKTLFNHFWEYLNLFEKTNELDKININYFSSPQIGAKK